MSEFRIDQIKNQAGTSGPDVAGITTFTGTSGIVMPSGNTAYRGGRGRGLFGSGATPGETNVIDYITIATTGNSIEFGNDNLVRQEGYAAVSSSTRGLFAGGLVTPSPGNDTSNIAYVTIPSTGNALNFGDLITAQQRNVGLSDSTRGISAGGGDPLVTTTIEFVTIASTGKASVFGDLTRARYGSGACASPTRGLVAGGSTSPGNTNAIDYITIQTTGNGIEFGDLTEDPNHLAGCSNSTRGLFGGGQTPTDIDVISYVTIASLGNAQDFGDLSAAKDYLGACASATRGVWAGGQTPTKLDVIEYVTISTLGDVTDFGNLTVARRFCQGLSDVHGGLG